MSRLTHETLHTRSPTSPLHTSTTHSSCTPDSGYLRYWWHDAEYIGAAHGSSGIMLALLDACALVPSALTPGQLQRVRTTVDYIRTLRLPSGNYPTQPGKASVAGVVAITTHDHCDPHQDQTNRTTIARWFTNTTHDHKPQSTQTCKTGPRPRPRPPGAVLPRRPRALAPLRSGIRNGAAIVD